jgi:hypothetical protein
MDFDKEGSRLLGMAVRALNQYREGNPFAGMAGAGFFQALDDNDFSAAYLATLEPLPVPLSLLECSDWTEENAHE